MDNSIVHSSFTDSALAESGFLSCSASTTATKSDTLDYELSFDGEVFCDWLSFRHDFSPENPAPDIFTGSTIKVDRDGIITRESRDFDVIREKSSNTSVVMKCDGRSFKFSGNIGRFAQADNLNGLTVIQCFEKAIQVIKSIYPMIDTREFAQVYRQGTPAEYGTYLTRLDLTSNFWTDSYSQLSLTLGSKRINRYLPHMGKYGPTWGYDSKRGNWFKAKLYDKDAELSGKRTPNAGETTARFEIQLGQEYLKRNLINHLRNWKEGTNMENIIYGRFANQLLKETISAPDWHLIPAKLRTHALLWRDGTSPKSYLKRSQFYNVKRQLLEYGIDIDTPCNIMTLTTRVREVKFQPLPCLRRVA